MLFRFEKEAKLTYQVRNRDVSFCKDSDYDWIPDSFPLKFQGVLNAEAGQFFPLSTTEKVTCSEGNIMHLPPSSLYPIF